MALPTRWAVIVHVIVQLKRTRLHIVDKQVTQLPLPVSPTKDDDVAVVDDGAVSGPAKGDALGTTDLPPDVGVVVVHVEILTTLSLRTSSTEDHHRPSMGEGGVGTTRGWLLTNLITLYSTCVVQFTLEQVTEAFVAVTSPTLPTVDVHTPFKLYGAVAVAGGWGVSLTQVLGTFPFRINAKQFVKPSMSVTPTKDKHLRDVPHSGVKRTGAL